MNQSELLRKESMKEEIATMKEHNRCEDCVWEKRIEMCSSCRLSEGNSYFQPNLFSRRVNA